MIMKRIFLFILIIITGLKTIADHGYFTYEYAVMKLVTQDDDSNNEKEDNKKSKRSSEEIYYDNMVADSLYDTSAIAGSSFDQQAYSHLEVRPITPPPDFI